MSQTAYEGRLFVGGEFVEARSGSRYEVLNPADESVVGTAADAGPEDVSDAVSAARAAADETSWATDHAFRLHCLTQFQRALRDRAGEIRALVTAEAGVPTAIGDTQVDMQIEGMDYFNELISTWKWEEDLGPYELLGMQSDRRIRYEPYGVVGAITPWNAPFMTNIWKVGHALATGNTVVLKSAPDTPLTAALMAQIAAESTDLPAGVFNAISSADRGIAGDALTGDPRVDLFHFTGSPGVGQRIAERAAVGIRHVVLELGGKSANVLLPDADLDMACGLGVVMCMNNSGQGCALATRMVVHADIYDEVLQRLAAIVGALSYGDPTDPANLVGPIIRAEQVDRIEAMVQRAREGRRPNPGRRQPRKRQRQGLLVRTHRARRGRRELRDRSGRGVRAGAVGDPLRRWRRRRRAGGQQHPLRAVGLRAIPRPEARLGSGQPTQGRHRQHQQLLLPVPRRPLRRLRHQRRRRRTRQSRIRRNTSNSKPSPAPRTSDRTT